MNESDFGFAVSLACTTGVIHFVQLTAVRRIQNRTIAEAFAFMIQVVD